ncbi:hypothetical protein BU56_30835 [Escherichia coli O145:H25 str. 07-3858]|nr:hypothetical protein BU56_30835 [Escherichia coli O145:H25 str. 07-3858]
MTAVLHHVLKSAVGAGDHHGPAVGQGSLSEYQEYAQDFIDYLRSADHYRAIWSGRDPCTSSGGPFNIRVHAPGVRWLPGLGGWRVRPRPLDEV